MFAPVPGSPTPPFGSLVTTAPTYTLVCDVGLFTLTGQDADFVYTPSTIVIDTHDGFDGKKKRYEEEARKKEQLRYLLQHAFDPEQYPWPIPEPEVVDLADEFVEKTQSGIEIDWNRLERENVIRTQLYAMASEFERQRREFEEDEEDVLTLLLH